MITVDDIKCECGSGFGLWFSERLDRWICPSCLEKSPATVWLLTIGHKHGEDTSVHSTEESANDVLYDYVAQWWSEVEDHVEDGEMPEDQLEAISLYFHIQDEFNDCREWADIQQHEIDGQMISNTK